MKLSVVIKRLILLTISVLSTWLVYLGHQSSTAYEFGLKANKYVELNLDKNWGIRKKTLEFAQFFLSYYPHPNYVEYEKSDTQVGLEDPSLQLLSFVPESGKPITVNNAQTLIQAFREAKAGDVILLSPGNYQLKSKSFKLKHSGTASQPIVLTAATFGTATLQMDSVEGLYLDQAYWSISNIIFEGICQSHSKCEHAIHLTGDADNIVIRNNRFINFNAHIKSNGKNHHFPDHVTISGNDFYNQSARNTKNPVTPIDVVGGNDWLIENNFIADFALQQHGKFTVTYGAFLKGGGERGIINNNVVNCAWKIPHQSFLDIRIGLSLGGGGTGGAFYQNVGGSFEHSGGIIENNLIINCSNDVGIYLNKAAKSKVNNNILLNTLGIDIRYNSSSATLEKNQYQGRIKARDGAWIRKINNIHLP